MVITYEIACNAETGTSDNQEGRMFEFLVDLFSGVSDMQGDRLVSSWWDLRATGQTDDAADEEAAARILSG